MIVSTIISGSGIPTMRCMEILAVEDDPTHTVSYLGVLQQALLDLSAWVEKGIAPAATTNYKIVDGQVVVPPTAEERKGIQPVVTVKANGGKRADVKVGEPVTFTAVVEVLKIWVKSLQHHGTLKVCRKILVRPVDGILKLQCLPC